MPIDVNNTAQIEKVFIQFYSNFWMVHEYQKA